MGILASATPSFDLTGVMTTSVNAVQGQLFGVLTVVVPAIVLVVGAVIGIKFGISWIKKMRA